MSEAMRNDGEVQTISSILDWVNGGKGIPGPATYELTGRPQMAIYIDAPSGTMRADVGDYIVRLDDGEFLVCKPDAFARDHGRGAIIRPAK